MSWRNASASFGAAAQPEWRRTTAGRLSGFSQRFSPQGRRLKDWEIAAPASNSLKNAAFRLDQGDATTRRARMIVLSFINHPNLLHDFWDEFAGVDLGLTELDSVRALILDAVSQRQPLNRRP